MRSRLTEASSIAASRIPALIRITFPYDVSQSASSTGQVEDRGPDAGPEQDEDRDEGDVREARHADDESGDPFRAPAGCAR